LEYYLKKKYRLVDKNWRIRQGELDLILRKGNILVFVEVKTVNDRSPVQAVENITHRKQKKLQLLAELYLSTHPLPSSIQMLRVDAAEVTETEGNCNVTVLENIIEL